MVVLLQDVVKVIAGMVFAGDLDDSGAEKAKMKSLFSGLEDEHIAEALDESLRLQVVLSGELIGRGLKALVGLEEDLRFPGLSRYH